MKTQIFRFILYSIIAGLTCLNLTAASSPPPGENGVHFCGFTEHQSDTRRYARSLANLDVGEPRMVRLIYFHAQRLAISRADVVQKNEGRDMHKHSSLLRRADGGARLRGGNFPRRNRSRKGEPLVHHVNGKHPDQSLH